MTVCEISTDNFPSCVKVGEWEHPFTAINKEGHAVFLTFWARVLTRLRRWRTCYGPHNSSMGVSSGFPMP